MNKIFDLTGRTALVTGGGTGLGKHFAFVLAEAGATVVLSARRVEKLEETANEITRSGGRAICIPMDVGCSESIIAALTEATEKCGPVSIVVNNAGVVAKPSLLKVTEEEWDGVLDINLKGPWLVAREAVKLLQNTGLTGSIINIASILGMAVQKGTGPYAASKAALIHLTKNMAIEWARFGVRVNAIAPGYYTSEMADEFLVTDAGKALINGIPQRRLGNHEDLTGAILVLASDASAYMTGTTTVVDGGHSISTV